MCIALLQLLMPYVYGQSPILLDMQADSPPVVRNTNPHNLYSAGDQIIFYGSYDWSTGQLISLDKQDSFTVLSPLKSTIGSYIHPMYDNIIQLGNTVYFTAYDTTSKYYPDSRSATLWQLLPNGSISIIKDKNTQQQVAVPSHIVSLNNELYMWGLDDDSSRQVYRYNPSKQTIKQITSFSFPPLGEGDILENDLVVYKDRIYFQGYDSVSMIGTELYTYDPILDITWLIDDLTAGSSGSWPQQMTVYDNNLFFITFSHDTIRLYQYNAISKPQLLTTATNKGYYSNTLNLRNREMPVINDVLYFKYIESNNNSSSYLGMYNLSSHSFSKLKFDILDYIAYHDKLYLVSSTPNITWNFYNNRLYVLDGTNMPKKLFNDISGPANLTLFNDMLYFNSIGNGELYRFHDSSLTIEKVRLGNKTIAFPNPVRNVLNIQIDLKQSQKLSVTLTDMQGKVVYRSQPILYSKAKHTITLPLNRISAGLYFYHLNAGNNILSSGKINKL